MDQETVVMSNTRNMADVHVLQLDILEPDLVDHS
jgi:hypothetical protein